MTRDSGSEARQLLSDAHKQGRVALESIEAIRKAQSFERDIALALGADAIDDRDPILVTLLVNDSASINDPARQYYDPDRRRTLNGPELVRDGHNRFLAILREDGVQNALIQTRLLNRGLVSPFTALSAAPELTLANYSPDGDYTPLFQQSVITLGSVLAKTQQLLDRGRNARAVTIIITDGIDNDHSDFRAEHVRWLTRDMLEFSSSHLLAGMGIGDEATFGPLFGSMGVPRPWILAGATPEEITEVFKRMRKALQIAASSESAFRRQLEAGPPPDDA